MSVRVMAQVWDLEIPTTEKMMLLAIADHADDEGTNAWPSIDTLARKTSLSRRQTQRVLANLVTAGLLDVEVQEGGDRRVRSDRRPNLYSVILGGVSSASSRDRDGVTSTTSRGDAHDASGVTPMSHKPSLEPSLEPSNESASTSVDASPEAEAVCEAVARGVAMMRDGARPPITARWRTDARLLLERGPSGQVEATPLPIEKVLTSIEFLFARMAEPDRNGFCWAAQVRSPGALRKHWHQIALASRQSRLAQQRRDPLSAIIDGTRRASQTGAMRAIEAQGQVR